MYSKQMDHWVKYCDIIWADYNQDVKFYKNEALNAKGKILEIGCGSGRIYLGILKQGCDIYGLDVSPKMLKLLERKSGKLKPKVYEVDMRDFKLTEKFSMVIIPFRTFLCNLTTEDQLRTLNNIKTHLLPKGKLILDIFYPSLSLLKSISKRKVIKRKISNKFDSKYSVRNVSHFTDDANNILSWTTTLYENEKKIWDGEASITLIHKREFELLLREVGFRKWKLYSDFNYTPFETPKKDMVWIIENGG